jgi:hypothetical protein
MNRTKRNLLYVSIYLFGLALITPQINLLGRFPWQDLIYCDFQIYNSWRWFSENLQDFGLGKAALSTIDFRMNFGENIFTSSRVANPMFDIGAWFYHFLGDPTLALLLKFIVYSFFTFFGCLKLIAHSSKIHATERTKVIIFTICLTSILAHPALFHEVGPMVFWYLMLTPLWFYTFDRAVNFNFSETLKSPIFPCLVLLTLGSSDLFIFFYFFNLSFVIFLLNTRSVQNFKKVFSLLLFIECLFLITKIPYFYFLFSNEVESKSGTYGLIYYLENFLIPNIQFGIFTPYFFGPVSLFVNLVVICAFIYVRITRTHIVQYLSTTLWLFGLLSLEGSLLHSIPIFRENLPSAFRYHFAIFPFLVSILLITGLWNQKQGGKYPQVLKIKKPNLKIGFPLLIVACVTILAIPQNVYDRVTPAASKRVVDHGMEKWFTTDLPNCIKDYISKSDYQDLDRSYIFATSAVEKGRNDALTYLIENPKALDGRTFMQWRYSTSTANVKANKNSGLYEFNTWAFSDLSSQDIFRFSLESNSPFLISSTRLEHPGMDFIGRCDYPIILQQHSLPFRSIWNGARLGNISLESNLYLYHLGADLKEVPTALRLEYRSGSVEAGVRVSGQNTLVLPVNYSKNLRISNGDELLTFTKSSNNLVVLNLRNYKTSLPLDLQVYSQTLLGILNVSILSLLILWICINLLFKLKRE